MIGRMFVFLAKSIGQTTCVINPNLVTPRVLCAQASKPTIVKA
jgi:hypothetical protein